MRWSGSKFFQPEQLFSGDPPPLEQFGFRFLGEGDSWFTIGALNPLKNSNLLFEMAFGQTACVVNCATPGDTLNVVDALAAPAVDAQGLPVPADRRLLLTAAEWGPPEMGARRYLSDDGWRTFCAYLQANFEHVIALRDRGPSAARPIFLHGYAFPTPRPAGTGLGSGP